MLNMLNVIQLKNTKKKDKNTKDKEKQVYQRIQILEQKSIG